MSLQKKWQEKKNKERRVAEQALTQENINYLFGSNIGLVRI